jgi:hypothetical protein
MEKGKEVTPDFDGGELIIFFNRLLMELNYL